MTRNRNNNLSKSLKDYAVPLIWLVLILILLFSVFSGWDNTKTQDNNKNIVSNTWEIQVSLDWEDSKAYIIYESWKKVLIEDTISLQKSEKISVESWDVTIDFPFFAKMKLKENWEIAYKEDGSIFLESWNLWVESMSNIDIFMKFAEISIPSGDIVNLSQNDIESVIYSIDWNILVSNLAWKSVQLKSLEKLSIKSKDSTSNEINLDSEKKQIDDYFKLSSWFKQNGWDDLLNNKIENNLSWTWLLDKKINLKSSNDLISFDNLQDESYVKTDKIDVVGRYSPLKVWKITINNNETKLDSELWTFSLKWFLLNSKTNDLVIKIFDKDSNLILKKVMTIYTNKVLNTSNTLVLNKKLENFPVKATDFIIYEPTKTGKLTTTSGQITIRWIVKNKNVDSVIVNDYKLKSYNGSTWRYHAFTTQWTLKNGANNYEIKYLDKDWKLIYKEYYSIYKEFKVNEKKEVKKISGEVKVN